MRIAHADDPALVEDDERVGAADARQDLPKRRDGVGRLLVGEKGGQQLRVGRGRQARPAAGQLVEQLAGVHEVPVVADGDRAPGSRRKVGWAFSQTVDPVVE